MAIKNIARGGKGAIRAEIKGLKELEAKVKKLSADNPTLKADVVNVVGETAEGLKADMRRSAQGAGWASQSITARGRSGKAVKITGQQAIDSIFAYNKQRGGGSRYRISALAGVGKQRTMVEWIAGRHPKSPNARVAAGKPVAESFAAMLEMGTSRRAARPAIRQAIQGAKSGIVSALANGWNDLLTKYSQ